MFDNPEIDKLIIFALLGMVAVLGIAVIFLAVKKNTYYVDESGNEIPPVSKKQAQARVQQQPVYEEYGCVCYYQWTSATGNTQCIPSTHW